MTLHNIEVCLLYSGRSGSYITGILQYSLDITNSAVMNSVVENDVDVPIVCVLSMHTVTVPHILPS